MKTTDALKVIMKKREVGTNKLADRLGKRPTVISERIHQENISVLKLNELLKVLDYKIVLVPRETTEKEDWMRIE